MSQLRVPVGELGLSNSKPYRKFKSPLISLMIVNNGGNKLVLMRKSFSSKGSRPKQSDNQGTQFYRGLSKPFFDEAGCKKNISCHVCVSNL